MKPFTAFSVATTVGLWWWRLLQRNTAPSMSLPGEPERLDTRLLGLGAAVLQSKAPLAAMGLYLDGFHFMRRDRAHQVEVHHYCARLNEDMTQCVIFDGNTRDARLVGVEYLISERFFAVLPEEEKKMWHSHQYDVTSGLLAAPGLPRRGERAVMNRLVHTYGKAWSTWNTERDALPVGSPELLMAFTADDQIRGGLVESRDLCFGISTAERRRERRDITAPPGRPAAD
jgi:hypothetical protein